MTSQDLQLSEAKNLVIQAQLARTEFDAVSSLTLAVNILLGLVEGHRHQYWSGRNGVKLTGPMQAMEGR